CTITAGAKPEKLAVEIVSEAENIKSYGWSLPAGETLIALWSDGAAVEDDPGLPAKVVVEGFGGRSVTGVDVL
ncbi:MAG: hypothetical protein GWO44_04795, partial [Thermoplasmata archaeon]|nr:hypothetical protein [Thermoplasmata archaeon]NIY02608.1 hypothetical protein [Thermoplasmata archaeon]